MKIINNQKGFSLLEALIASGLLVVGLVGLASLSGSVVTKNNWSEKNSIATTLAQEKLEELKNQTDTTVLRNSDSGSDTMDGVFSRTWTIANGGAGNLTQLDVTVNWPNVGNREVKLQTLIRQ